MTAAEQIREWNARVEAMEREATPGPWVVQELQHATGDLWLQIGLPSGFGPVVDMAGCDAVRPAAVAGMKYHATPESEQRANAALVASARTELPRARMAIAEMVDGIDWDHPTLARVAAILKGE